jgi:hypothetical protein
MYSASMPLQLDELLQQQFRRDITLLTDIQGSTAYFERHGDLGGRQMVQRHNDVLFPWITHQAQTYFVPGSYPAKRHSTPSSPR